MKVTAKEMLNENPFQQKRKNRKMIQVPQTFDLIMPDRNIVNAAFKANPRSMEFRIDESHNWNRFGMDFVFHIDDKETINEYVLGIKQAKIDQERKMRRELDLRVMALKINDQEFQAFGKALLERIRFYIKAYYGRLDRSNLKHSADAVAGSEYFYDS